MSAYAGIRKVDRPRTFCPWCGAEVAQRAGGRARVYCSAECGTAFRASIRPRSVAWYERARRVDQDCPCCREAAERRARWTP